MTNAHSEASNTRELIDELARRQDRTQQQLDDFLSTANQVLARSAVLDGVVLELRDTTEQHQRNFEEHQKATNAAIERLEAILLQLIPKGNQ